MSTSPPSIDSTLDDAVALLQVVCDAARRSSLEDRRRETLAGLLRLLGADAGWWAWGHGHPVRSAITPVAIIHVGFEPTQLGLVIQGSLHAVTAAYLRAAVAPYLDYDRQRTSLRSDIVETSAWKETEWYRLLVRADLVEFVHSVRYQDIGVWTNLMFYKRLDRGGFAERERDLLDRAMAGISWFHVGSEEAIPPELLSQLTPRRRAVLLLLLDGKSRKQIADLLRISDHTAHEHIKGLYRHFDVGSIAELAAGFLRSKS